jgi:hypothetical protein
MTNFWIKSVTEPARSDWSVHVCEEITYTPLEGREPCRFHMWMQELAFGFRWRKR